MVAFTRIAPRTDLRAIERFLADQCAIGINALDVAAIGLHDHEFAVPHTVAIIAENRRSVGERNYRRTVQFTVAKRPLIALGFDTVFEPDKHAGAVQPAAQAAAGPEMVSRPVANGLDVPHCAAGSIIQPGPDCCVCAIALAAANANAPASVSRTSADLMVNTPVSNDAGNYNRTWPDSRGNSLKGWVNQLRQQPDSG